MLIIGVSAFYHDSAVAFILDGEIIFAAQEERFSRIKHDHSFPKQALKEGFNFTQTNWADVTCVVYYDKPWLKFERILETYYGFAPKGFKSFKTGLPVWLKEKVFLPKLIYKYIPKNIPLKFSTHHMSHASSAFYPSPFEDAAVLTMDGVGEWATTTIAHGSGKDLNMLRCINFPHSLGLLYSSFTYFCGFKVNSGEYKLMGLAPYGEPGSERVENFKHIIKTKLCKIFDDGSFWLDQEYFAFATDLVMIDEKKWEEIFCIPSRKPEAELSSTYCDLALAIQEVTQEIIILLAKTAKRITGSNYLCLAGGVALNCVANGALLKEKIFKDIWIQPAAGDAGGAIGAALGYYYSQEFSIRNFSTTDSMSGAYLGQSYTNEYIKDILDGHGISYIFYQDLEKQYKIISSELSNSKVVGWFKGRMEFGPRALGARSILASASDVNMQKQLNLKIKYRESFRPFAPVIIEDDLSNIFVNAWKSPYMLVVDHLQDQFINDRPTDYLKWGLEQKLYFHRSKFQTIAHLDYSSRVQSVSTDTNPELYALLSYVKDDVGYGILANTSFNVRGEPIVSSPDDAIRCFFQTEMDILVLEGFMLFKKEQSLENKRLFNDIRVELALD